jgi:hypothetical protein
MAKKKVRNPKVTSSAQRVKPERLAVNPEKYLNKWVAVRKDGVVLVAASSRRELAEKAADQKIEPSSFVARYIHEPPSSTVIGLG